MYKKFLDGIIEVIIGLMFLGKSDELIKRIRILFYVNVKILVVKLRIDFRFFINEIVFRVGIKIFIYVVEIVVDIKSLFEKLKYKVIVIDEV